MTENIGEPRSVFFSYSMPDYRLAKNVRERLKRSGHRVWIAPDDISPGSEYPEEVEKAIIRAEFFVLFFSRAANDSIFVRKEVERAIARRVPIIPIRLENFTPSSGFEFLLSNVQWVDAIGRDSEEIAQLIAPLLRAEPSESTVKLTKLSSGIVRLTWPVWFVVIILSLLILSSVNFFNNGSVGFEFFRLVQQRIYSLDLVVIILTIIAILLFSFALDRVIRVRGRVISVRSGDLTAAVGIFIGVSLFAFGLALAPLGVTILLLVLYVFSRQTLKNRPRLIAVFTVSAMIFSAFWVEPQLYAARSTGNTMVLLLPEDRCIGIAATDCRKRSGENYIALYHALNGMIANWKKVDFFPNDGESAKTLRDRFIRNDEPPSRTDLARLTVETFVRSKPFDRAVLLTLNWSPEICERQSVQINAQLHNWNYGRPPRLAFGKLEAPARGGWTSVIKVPQDKIDRAAFYLSVDLVARLAVTTDTTNVASGPLLDDEDIAIAVDSLFDDAERALSEVRQEVDPVDYNRYRQFLIQASDFQDPSIRLGALKTIAEWLRDVSDNASNECLETLDADRALRTLSFASTGEE